METELEFEEEEEAEETEATEVETEEEEEAVEDESEEEGDEEDEEEDEDDEDEEEEIEELEEMTSPRVSCWLGADGKKYKGVMTVDDDINYPGNKCQYDDCVICLQLMTHRGKHRLCCVPCGHLYGFSCIKKWLLQSSFSGKCPQCNFVCECKDVVPLVASTVCVRAHQKATSARYFPFTAQGFIEFKEHEWVRHLDAEKRYHDDYKRLVDVVEQQGDLARRQAALKPQWDDLIARGLALNQRAKKLGQPVGELEGFDALQRQHRDLRQLHEAWGQRFKALGRVAIVLRRWIDVWVQRYHAYGPSLKFFYAMCQEYFAQQKNTEPCAASTIPKPLKDTLAYHHASTPW